MSKNLTLEHPNGIFKLSQRGVGSGGATLSQRGNYLPNFFIIIISPLQLFLDIYIIEVCTPFNF